MNKADYPNKGNVELIPVIASFVESTEIGDVKVGLLTEEHRDSLYSTAHRANDDFKDRFVHVGMNTEYGRVFAIGVSKEDREKELKDINYANKWKKKIPYMFREKRFWKEGDEFFYA